MMMWYSMYCLRYPLEEEGHPHDVFSTFCSIIFVAIVHDCIGELFLTALSMHPMWHFHFSPIHVGIREASNVFPPKTMLLNTNKKQKNLQNIET